MVALNKVYKYIVIVLGSQLVRWLKQRKMAGNGIKVIVPMMWITNDNGNLDDSSAWHARSSTLVCHRISTKQAITQLGQYNHLMKCRSPCSGTDSNTVINSHLSNKSRRHLSVFDSHLLFGAKLQWARLSALAESTKIGESAYKNVLGRNSTTESH